MRGILVIVMRMLLNQVKCNCRETKSFFFQISLRFWNLHKTLKFWKKDESQSLSIFYIFESKTRDYLNV